MKCRAAHLPVYPFLVASLPLVNFYLGNFRLLGPADGIRLLALYFLLTALILVLGRLIWRQTARAALVVTPALLVLFWGGRLGVPASVVLFGASAGLGWLVRRYPLDARRLCLPLNLAALVFVALPAARIARAEWREHAPTPTALGRDIPQLAWQADTPPPDIYFLLIDGLGQPGFLREHYGLTRTNLDQVLAQRGFRVLPNSRSAYPQTALSAASTLNFGYVQDLLRIAEPDSRDRRVLARLVGHNRTTAALRSAGYAVATFPSGYPVTRFAAPDHCFQPDLNPSFLEYYALSESALALVQAATGHGQSDLLYALRRRRLEYIFDHLPAARQDLANDQPLFAFAHILAPHPPFVFDRDGGPRNPASRFGFADGSHWRAVNKAGPDAYRTAYADQAVYVLRRLGEAVDGILAGSPRPPLIIIQGDHGPGSGLFWEDAAATDQAERFGIWNAWYIPDGLALGLEPAGTPVNTFVRLFNGLFGTRLAVLPDQRWFATSSHPFAFVPVDPGGS